MKAQDIRVSATYTEPNEMFALSRVAAENRARQDVMHRLTNLLMETRSTRTESKYFVEWRLDLYVATPEQFWEIIHREAEEIAKIWCIKK